MCLISSSKVPLLQISQPLSPFQLPDTKHSRCSCKKILILLQDWFILYFRMSVLCQAVRVPSQQWFHTFATNTKTASFLSPELDSWIPGMSASGHCRFQNGWNSHFWQKNTPAIPPLLVTRPASYAPIFALVSWVTLLGGPIAASNRHLMVSRPPRRWSRKVKRGKEAWRDMQKKEVWQCPLVRSPRLMGKERLGKS